ncbi:MAG: PLP-dependent transferase, partial [Cypionkella sp.]
PFTSWIMLNGMATLDLRCRAMATSAHRIAAALQGDARIGFVRYPALASHPQHALAMAQMDGSGGTLVTFDLVGGKDAAFAFCNALDIIKISNNLGDAKSIATHPATTTHSRLTPEQKDQQGITPGLIRLSVGLEDTDDLIADLTSALNAIAQ